MLSILDVISSTRLLTNLGATCENKTTSTSYLRTEIRNNLQLELPDQSSKGNGRGYHSKVELSQFLQSPNLRYGVIFANTQEHACYPGEDTMRPDFSSTTQVDAKITHGFDIVLSVVLCRRLSLLNNWLLSALSLAFGRWQSFLPP